MGALVIDLTRFFGEGNAIGSIVLTDPQSEEAKRLRVFVEAVDKGAQVIALPRTLKRRQGLELWWYVFWSHDSLARIVTDGVRSFIGPTYSDMRYEPKRLDSADAFDARVASEVAGANGPRAIRLKVNPTHGKIVASRFARYIDMANRRPLRRAARLRPVGRVLRDFEFALGQGSARQAEECLDELRTHELLDAQNLAYTEIRFLARFQRFAAVLKHQGLADAVRIGAPRAVAESILISLYEEELRLAAESSDVGTMLRVASEGIVDRFQPLFSSSRLPRDPRAVAAFVCGLAALKRTHSEATTLARDLPQGFRGRHAILEVAARMVEPAAVVQVDPIARAQQAYDEADIDAAMVALRVAPPGIGALKLAVQCALDVQEPDVARFALHMAETVSSGGDIEFEESAGWMRRLQRVRELVGVSTPVANVVAEEPDQPHPVDGWIGWFRRLAEPREWASAVAVLQYSRREWAFEPLKQDGALESLLQCLKEKPDWGGATLQRAMPELVAAFVVEDESGERIRTFLPLIDEFYSELWVDDQPSVPSCAAMREVLLARVGIGTSSEGYVERLEMFGEVLERCGAPGAVGVALDAIDGLLQAPCPSEEGRLQFFLRAANLVLRFWDRLRIEEQHYCRALLGEVLPALQLPTADEGEKTADWEVLRGRYIAIYSLQEAALRRASRLLGGLIPESRIEVFSNAVGGDPGLRAAARGADLFVIVTRAAKHAATEFIEAERNGDIERPVGIGTNSIIDSVAQWRDRVAA